MIHRRSLLIDTNAAAAYLNGDSVLAQLLLENAVVISFVVLGELYYGAEHSTRREQNLARIKTFADGRVVIGCDEQTADHYGRIKSALRLSGRPIPHNDVWIAEQAIQHALAVVTRDAHFQHVQNLNVQAW